MCRNKSQKKYKELLNYRLVKFTTIKLNQLYRKNIKEYLEEISGEILFDFEIEK